MTVDYGHREIFGIRMPIEDAAIVYFILFMIFIGVAGYICEYVRHKEKEREQRSHDEYMQLLEQAEDELDELRRIINGSNHNCRS